MLFSGCYSLSTGDGHIFLFVAHFPVAALLQTENFFRLIFTKRHSEALYASRMHWDGSSFGSLHMDLYVDLHMDLRILRLDPLDPLDGSEEKFKPANCG